MAEADWPPASSGGGASSAAYDPSFDPYAPDHTQPVQPPRPAPPPVEQHPATENHSPTVQLPPDPSSEKTAGNASNQTTSGQPPVVGGLSNDFLRIDDSRYPARAQPSPAAGIPQQQPLVWGMPPPAAYGFMPATAADPNLVGRLTVVVERATLNKNYSTLVSMSPYVRMRVGHRVFVSESCRGGGKNPVFNKQFLVPLEKSVDAIYLEVLDECSMKEDTLIGWAMVEIPEELLIAGGDSGPTTHHKLSGKLGVDAEGTISLRMSLTLTKDLPPGTMLTVPPMMAVPYGGYCTPYPAFYVQPQPSPGGNTPVHVQPGCYSQRQQPAAAAPTANQTAASRQITDEDVKGVNEVFPSTEAEVVRAVLESCRGDKEAAINHLLQMTAPQ